MTFTIPHHCRTMVDLPPPLALPYNTTGTEAVYPYSNTRAYIVPYSPLLTSSIVISSMNAIGTL
jgi:hypothetical protein